MAEQSLEDRIKSARHDLEVSFKEFHELLGNKKLSDNKSAAEKNEEKNRVDNLYRAAVKLDNINIGEGPMALAIIALREMLKVRDRLNDFEYKMLTMLKDIKGRLSAIEQSSGIADEQKDK